MTERTHIDGLEVRLGEPPENALITDVVVIRRFVFPDDNSDGIMVASSGMTSGITATGMLSLAQYQDLEKWSE